MEKKKPNLADIESLLAQHTERVKELMTINRTTSLITEGKPVDETLRQIALILPHGWQYPQNACACILYDSKEYKSLRFGKTQWFQKYDFVTIDGKHGTIEVYYDQKFPDEDEGPFLNEERNLIGSIGSMVCAYLNGTMGTTVMKPPHEQENYKYKKIIYKESFKDSRELLQKFLNKQTADKNIFHDLMRFKVQEILLVATLYDTFILENEDRFFEQAMGELYHLSLSSLPRITGVTSPQAALEILRDRKFDFVVLMAGMDTKGSIHLVEDSPRYYSRYLPMLYTLVFEQTQDLISEVNTNELDKISRMRARTKIILATTYEEALSYFMKYQNCMACVISDVKFSRAGKIDETAGVSFLKFVQSHRPELPTILQSSDPGYSAAAVELKSTFMNKNSDTLLQDLKTFITYSLGFGHFIYRDNEGRKIAVAKSMKDFEKQLRIIPDESILYHALKNHFSLWLMARGEIQLAKIINPIKASDFNSPKELREYILGVIQNYRIDIDKGKVVNFDESAILDWRNIVSFGTGSLGGKGRGLAFISTLINNLDFSEIIPDIFIRNPRTGIIGTDEFEIFMERNNLLHQVLHENDYAKVRSLFMSGELSYELKKKLKILVRLINKPLAIRSSSIFEDSLLHPFAGVFETYMLPNSNTDFHVRYVQLQDAIKMVYASIFSPQSRTYFEAVNYRIEEEKMAVIIQEMVGDYYGDYYYPHISGTAQSYNFYPVSHMEPEDGFAVIALGLGRYVVEGEKAWRFCPKYPTVQISSVKDILKSSQVDFYATHVARTNLDLLEGEDVGLIRLNISEAEKHGSMKHLCSVYDPDNDRLSPGLDKNGPRVMNFANILQYNYIPLAKTVEVLLDMVKEALGTPVEIEYAVDLNRDSEFRASFYLLQIKPMVGKENDYNVELGEVNPENSILYAEKSLGNGRIKCIQDVIYIEPSRFNKLKQRKWHLKYIG